MRRALLAALVIAVPLFGGFECTVETNPPGWVVGDGCDYVFDADAATCVDSDTLRYCDWSGFVADLSCAGACGGAGQCAFDASLGYDVCVCDSWTPGAACEYDTDFSLSTCSGDTLTYCAVTDVIGAISCFGQCQDWYGAEASGYCGVQAETGYNGCVCDVPAGCNFAPYCYDALWLVSCVGGAEIWADCNTECVTAGYTKGVCDPSGCACS
jgi:hypothetical protein